MRTTKSPSLTRQRGAASLVVTLLLVFAMLIVVAGANRTAIVEARASANQYRSTQAFEAAEAGLEWALAKLNDPAPIGDDCRPRATPGALPFRDRQLRYGSAGWTPATWNNGGVPAALQAACVREGAGWSCHCPTGGAAMPATPAATSTAPAFNVTFEAGPKPGLIRAAATGCTRNAGVCSAAAPGHHEASARVEVLFGLVPGLRAAPVAALTAVGTVDAGAAALGLHNLDGASGGTAVHAGSAVVGESLRLTAPPGAALDASVVSNDATLAALTADRFFARWFGMDRASWTAQPAATRLACAGRCGAAVANAVASGSRLLAIEGDADIDGPLTLGSPERPIALVVGGTLGLRGAVTLHGVVAAGTAIDWRNASAAALVRGAALTAGDYRGNAEADFFHDAAVLARLQGGTGSFARVNGSWKDF